MSKHPPISPTPPSGSPEGEGKAIRMASLRP